MLNIINARLSLGARLGLLSALFVAPTALLTILFWNTTSDEVRFSERELDGARYLSEVWPALIGAGAVSAPSHEELDAQFGTGGAFSAFAAASGAERVAAGAALMDTLADASNLTLDSELDSFYAMDAATMRLPALLNTSTELSLAADHGASAVDLAIAVDRTVTASDVALQALEGAMKTNEAGDTRRALENHVQALQQAVKGLEERGQAIAIGGAVGDLDARQAQLARQIDVTWRATHAEMTRLIQARVDTLKAEQAINLAIVATTVLLASLLAAIIALGLSGRFGALLKAMDGLTANKLDTDIPCRDDKNETGRIAEALVIFKQGLAERARLEAERVAATEQQKMVVEALAGGLSALSKGDLTCQIERTFPAEYQKIRTDFNEAVTQLQDTMKTIVSNVHGIRTGASEISQAADDLSRRTEQQAASLEETAAALDQITATVRKSADGARQANQVVADTRGQAEKSGAVVRETVQAMSAIEDSSKRISQIISVIDEIAFQTNLLALNAGVEAARAGEAGRGFAVVASEVRALAQRSSEAAKEIKGLILASSQHVESGVDLVNRTGEALQEIVTRVEQINGLVSEIAASTQEQSTGLSQVNTAVNQMDQVTQQNAAMVEQSTAASHSLAGEADSLGGLVAHFNIAETVQVSRAPRPAPARKAPAVAATKSLPTRAAAALKPRAQTAEDEWEDF